MPKDYRLNEEIKISRRIYMNSKGDTISRFNDQRGLINASIRSELIQVRMIYFKTKRRLKCGFWVTKNTMIFDLIKYLDAAKK